jgi:hypothetical protein
MMKLQEVVLPYQLYPLPAQQVLTTFVLGAWHNSFDHGTVDR